MIPVDGFGNLYRDESTNAIINTDKIGYENYIACLLYTSDAADDMHV